MSLRPPSANALLLGTAARALGERAASLVLVGGCATEFLLSIERAEDPRPTDDVDLIAEVVSVKAYHALEADLRRLGFTEDRSPDAPICRWLVAGVKVDFLPTDEAILGFRNRWFPLAVETSVPLELPEGGRLRRIHAPVFVATKLEAFQDRGRGDFLESHDLEDLIAVVDGRPELADELSAAGTELKEFIRAGIGGLMGEASFRAALPGHLPGDAASQARLPMLMRRLEALTHI